MKKLGAALGVAVFGLALLLGGSLLPGRGGDTIETTSAAADAATLFAPGANPDLDTTIDALERRIAQGGPTLADDQAALAFGYLQKARVEAAPAFYDQAEEALAASLETRPKRNFKATLGHAILAGSRHDFQGQIEWGRRAVAINPFNSQGLGIVGDAYSELGHRAKALDAYQRSIDLRPDLSSFGRVSAAAQLSGDTTGAIAAMKRALGFAGTSRENAAWAHWQLGELYIGDHRFEVAEKHLDQALQLSPGFGSAIESTVHLTAARGDIPGAIDILSSLVDDFPLPGNFAFLGELYLLDHQPSKAEAAFAEADRRLEEYQAHEVLPDVDFITFWADRRIHLRRALRDARTLYSQRKSAAVSDSLAWALYANGRFGQAQRYADEALRRSVNDAGYHYHAGMIARALGQSRRAETLLDKALKLDPSWSIIESHRARRILSSQA